MKATDRSTPDPLGSGAVWFYPVVTVLTGLLIVSSLAGVAGGAAFYSGYPAALAGLVGQDIYTLAVALPTLVIAALWARRGATGALLVLVGTLFYFAYTYSFLVVGGFNALFLVYIAIVSLALYATLALLRTIAPERVAAGLASHRVARVAGAASITFAVLFIVLWGAMTAGAIAAGESPDAVRHAVVAIDGTVMLPLLLLGGILLWRRRPLGYVLGGLLLTKLTLTGFGLAFTTLLSVMWGGTLGVPDAFLLAVFGVMGATGLALLVPYIRALKGEASAGTRTTGGFVGVPIPPSPSSSLRSDVLSKAIERRDTPLRSSVSGDTIATAQAASDVGGWKAKQQRSPSATQRQTSPAIAVFREPFQTDQPTANRKGRIKSLT